MQFDAVRAAARCAEKEKFQRGRWQPASSDGAEVSGLDVCPCGWPRLERLITAEGPPHERNGGRELAESGKAVVCR